MGCKAIRPAAEPPAGAGINCPPNQRAAYSADQTCGGKWWTWDRFAVMPPRTSPDGSAPAGMAPMSMDVMFETAARNNGSTPALRVERNADGSPYEGSDPGKWVEWTWSQYFDEASRAAKGMLSLGLTEKSAVCIYGFNSPEWTIAQQAAILGNAAACGIYPTDKVENVQYKARHGGCNVAVVESLKHLNVFKAAVAATHLGGIPTLRAIVVWLPCDDLHDCHQPDGSVVRVLSWKQLVNEEAQKVPDSQLADVRKKIQPGGLCQYVYTSGTTGKPKAVMLSHDNIAYLCSCLEHVVPDFLDPGQKRMVSYLPLSHVAGVLIDIAAPVAVTAREKGIYATVSFARPSDLSKMTLAERIQAVRPSVFLGVPRVWEKIRDRMMALTRANPPDPKTRARIDGAKDRGRQFAYNRQMGGTGERPGNCLNHFIDDKVYAVVRSRLGLDQCKMSITGAASMDISCLEFFGQLGIDICDLYGMSESCGVTMCNTPGAHVWGSVGWAVPGAEVKIFKAGPDGSVAAQRAKEEPETYPSFADIVGKSVVVDERYQGEICFRGRHIMMGYMANPDLGEEHVAAIAKQNADAIDDEGWLHSGDKGAMDTFGVVRVTGRFKEIIIPAGGENVSPIPIEEAVKGDKFVKSLVSNVMMVGDKRKYCVALISLRVVGATGQEPGGVELVPEAVEAIQAAGGSSRVVAEAVEDPVVYTMIAKAVDRVNKDSSVCPVGAATIKAFTIIPHDFSESGGQLTATLKLKRSVVEAEHETMVGSRDSKDGVGPGMSGILYKTDELIAVDGVGKVYGKYQGEAMTLASVPGSVPTTGPSA